MKSSLIIQSFIYLLIFLPSQNIWAKTLDSTITNQRQKRVADMIQKGKTLDNEEAVVHYFKARNFAKKYNLKEEFLQIEKEIGHIYYTQKKYVEAKKKFKSIISVDSSSIHSAASYLQLALIYRNLKKIDSLLLSLNQALNFYNLKPASFEKFEAYRKIGILFRNNGNRDKAMKLLLQALKGFKDLDHQPKVASTYNSIAAIHRLLGNYKTAKEYYWKGLHIRKRIGDTIALAYNYNNLGNAYKENNELDSAIILYKRAIDLKKTIGNEAELGRMLSNLASVHYQKKEYSLAYTTYLEALKQKRKEKDSISMLYTHNELTMTQIQMDNLTLAKKHLDTANFFRRTIYTEFYEKSGNTKKALALYKEYHSTYRKNFDEKQAKTIETLKEQFESEQKQQRIDSLFLIDVNNKDIITKQGKQLYQNNVALWISIGLLGFISILFLLFRQQQKINRTKHTGIRKWY